MTWNCSAGKMRCAMSKQGEYKLLPTYSIAFAPKHFPTYEKSSASGSDCSSAVLRKSVSLHTLSPSTCSSIRAEKFFEFSVLSHSHERANIDHSEKARSRGSRKLTMNLSWFFTPRCSAALAMLCIALGEHK